MTDVDYKPKGGSPFFFIVIIVITLTVLVGVCVYIMNRDSYTFENHSQIENK